MCFDKNINRNRDVKFLECNYLLLQRCVKLTLAGIKLDLWTPQYLCVIAATVRDVR